MDIRPITDNYAVSPQIAAPDMAEIKAAGFSTVICNRPDIENPPALQAEQLRIAAEAVGLDFHVLELNHQSLNMENAAKQKALIDNATGPVLAYCASGNRCTVIWSLGAAGQMSADDIIDTAAKAGYQIEQMRPMIEAASTAA